MAQKKFTLYWSNLAKYEDCPQQFLWSRGWGSIDVGGGPGRPKPKVRESSRHHAVLGISIQSVIERFYNDELWRTMTPTQLRGHLLEMAESVFRREVSNNYIDWRESPPRDELLQLVRNGILGYMRTLKQHRLLGPYARAEVDLNGYADENTPVGGRPDVIIRRDDTGITILDGKNSKRYKNKTNSGEPWMTFTDPDQLRWYALCHYLHHKRYPDRLGFVYYRYPYGDPMLSLSGTPIRDEEGVPKVEPGISWVSFDEEDIQGLRQRAITARKSMDAECFDAKPCPNTCRMCDYDSVCPSRQAQLESNRRRKKGQPSETSFSGLVELSFDSDPAPYKKG